MRSAFSHNPLRYPSSWSVLNNGQVIKDAVEDVCNEFVQRVFGYHFLKLGRLSAEISLKQCTIQHVFSQATEPSPFTSVMARSCELPYAENSIDGVLLANELDFAQDPHQIIRETDRILTQNGYVLISGFNPLSLTGLLRLIPFKRDSLLHDARFFSSNRVKDWLQLLSFEIVAEQHVLYAPIQCKHRGWFKHFQSLLGRYLPGTGAVYVILARKRVIPMTVVRPSLKLKPKFSAVGASAAVSINKPTY